MTSVVNREHLLATKLIYVVLSLLVAGCGPAISRVSRTLSVYVIPELQEAMEHNPVFSDAHVTVEAVEGNPNMFEFTGDIRYSLPRLDPSKPGTTQTVEPKPMVWSPGTTHTLKGTLRIAGYRFESDPASPLVFKLVWKEGYVYQGGRGTVITPRGEVISLAK